MEGDSQLKVLIPLSAVALFALKRLTTKLFFRHRVRKSLTGRVVCITGASSGIGKALASCCFAYGAKLILVARRKEVLDDIASELFSSHPNRDKSDVKIVVADLEKLEDIPEKGKEILSCYNRVDVLINNAGIGFRGSVLDTVLDVHKQVMAVNYFSQIALTKSLLPNMMALSTPSTIVSVSSLQGKFSLPYRSAYSASKFAIQSFFDSLRGELAHTSKVKVCVVSPGYVATEISRNAVTSSGSRYGKMDKTTSSGMTAEKCALEVVDAIVYNKPDVCIAPWYHTIVQYVRVLTPGLYFRLMNGKAKKDAKLYGL